MKLQPSEPKSSRLSPLEARVLDIVDPERGSSFATIVEQIGLRADDGPSIDLTLRNLVKRRLMRVSVITLPMGVGGPRSRYFLTERGAVSLKGLGT
jgi:hypothetical protein